MKKEVILPVLVFLVFLFRPAGAEAQLRIPSLLHAGEEGCLVLSGCEAEADSLSMARAARLELSGCALQASLPLGRVRLRGSNRLEAGRASGLDCAEGETDLLSDMELEGSLEETASGRLSTSTGSVLRKRLSLPAGVLTGTGLGFSLEPEGALELEAFLRLRPVERHGEASLDRVLAFSRPVSLRAARVSVPAGWLSGMREPRMYSSPYGLEAWKPVPVSTQAQEGARIVVSSGPVAPVEALAVFSRPSLRFPLAITANGDGINDRFEVEGVENPDASRLVVLTPSGTVVFDRSPYRNDFDGAGLPTGTYYYLYWLDRAGEPAKKATLTVYR